MFINPSDVASIAHSSLIITAIMARLFLNEKLTFAHLISLILTAIGVLFISKPSFLFNTKNSNLNYNSSNLTLISNKLETNSNSLSTIFGISLTFAGAFSSSLVYLVLKKLSNSKVHWANSTICVSWFGLPFSILLSVALVQFGYFHSNIGQEKNNYQWTYSILFYRRFLVYLVKYF